MSVQSIVPCVWLFAACIPWDGDDVKALTWGVTGAFLPLVLYFYKISPVAVFCLPVHALFPAEQVVLSVHPPPSKRMYASMEDKTMLWNFFNVWNSKRYPAKLLLWIPPVITVSSQCKHHTNIVLLFVSKIATEMLLCSEVKLSEASIATLINGRDN